jgi:hypothetical protein
MPTDCPPSVADAFGTWSSDVSGAKSAPSISLAIRSAFKIKFMRGRRMFAGRSMIPPWN